MNKCPHCEGLSISTWKKINATKAFPAKCPKCNEPSFLPAWWHVGSILSMEFLLWGSIIVALLLQSWFALAIIPIVIVLLVNFSKKLSLVPTKTKNVMAERKLMVAEILGVVSLLMIYKFFTG